MTTLHHIELDLLRAQLTTAQQEAAKWYERLEVQYKIIEKVCEERDRLQAELEAADRAGTWQPLPDGKYGQIEVDESGSELGMYARDPYGHDWPTEAFLGDDLRLCRRVLLAAKLT